MTDSNRVFFDTNPLIYYLEDEGEYGEKIAKFMDDYAEYSFVTSSITIAEYLTGVYKSNSLDKEIEFKEMISDYMFDVISVDWDIAEEAARIRGKHSGYKTMDALQLATAKLSGCSIFLSNDKQLEGYSDVSVLTIGKL